MLIKSTLKILVAAAVGTALLSPALAAKRHMHRMAGACHSQVGRCISDCDQVGWCQMNICTNGQSTPVALWRCFEPSGLCFAPRC